MDPTYIIDDINAQRDNDERQRLEYDIIVAREREREAHYLWHEALEELNLLLAQQRLYHGPPANEELPF